LFTLVVLKIGTMADKGLLRSYKIQWFPLRGYKPLPPNSPKDTFREEIVREENYYDTGSVATPLIEHREGTLVIVQEGYILPVNLALTNPLDPLLVQ
jgi:hypothetical protein